MEEEITPKDSYYSIETLAERHPKKTGEEIIAMYVHGKRCYQAWCEKRDKSAIALANKLVKVGYWTISYSGLKHWLHITKAIVINGEVEYDGYRTKISHICNDIKIKESMSLERWEKYSGCEITQTSKENYDLLHEKIQDIFNF